MNSLPNTILAIAPGKRELGIAVFNNTDLIYSSVKTLKQRKLSQPLFTEVRGIIESLFESFAPDVIVIKAISQYQKLSAALKAIVKLIRFESKRAGLPVVKITLGQIKATLCKSEKQTQQKGFETLLASYPQLQRYWNRPSKWQKDYYAFLFSAVASGAVYLKTLSESD